jgi:hypothetical protein
MTLHELFRELERHDWFHQMSDDHRVFVSGQEDWRRLDAAAKSIEGGKELFQAYSKHVFSGEAFGTPKHPKPDVRLEVKAIESDPNCGEELTRQLEEQ